MSAAKQFIIETLTASLLDAEAVGDTVSALRIKAEIRATLAAEPRPHHPRQRPNDIR